MKRASTDAKKLERRATILAQARTWIASRTFDEVRLADMAKELGIVKGTLYLYFPTKQDLFASIFIEEMEGWWRDLKSLPPTTPGADTVAALEGRELLVRLLPSLHMTIEAGLSERGLRELKDWFLAFSAGAAADLERRYSPLEGRGGDFMVGLYALTVGMSQLTSPPDRVRSLLCSEEKYAPLRVDFRGTLRALVDALYRGCAAPTSPRP